MNSIRTWPKFALTRGQFLTQSESFAHQSGQLLSASLTEHSRNTGEPSLPDSGRITGNPEVILSWR
jgi:hypothetical protein